MSETMTVQERFERLLGDLYWCERAARIGMKHKPSLEPKLEAYRVERVLAKARSVLRLQVFEFEAATEGVTPEDVDAPLCETCGNLPE